MNLGKQELDALLKTWPAALPAREKAAAEGGDDEERRWDERADAIAKAAFASEGAVSSGEVLDALLAAPALAPEPGESGVVFLSGEKKMDQDKEPGDVAHKSVAPAAAPPTERKRTSLKEFATRASQSGRPSSPGLRPSSPGSPGNDGGSAGKVPPSLAPPRPSTATPVPRPVEAGKDDSGVINLDVVRASATAQQVAAAEKAKPGQVGLFDDDKTVESAVNPAEQAVLAKAPTVAVVGGRKNRTGPIAGAAIAVLGIAAAFAILHKNAPAPAPQAAPIATESRPLVATAATPTSSPSATPQGTTAPTALAVGELPSAPSTDPDSKPGEPSRGALPAVPVATGAGAPSKDAVADARGAAPAGKPGDLQSEMARAVGGGDHAKAGDPAPAPEPAAANTKNQNVPEQPSQGSVQAAVGAVIGGAKACVAGADDISRAQVTFSSSGTVSSVSVTGWAAAHGKSGCVQAALKGAKVGPFSKPSFTVPVPIRP